MFSSYWAGFLLTAFILNISPGPDMVYLISQTISYGKKTGLASVLGLGLGALVHTVCVSFGISAIIASSITVFTIIKWLGAGYLLWMGIKSLLYGGIDFTSCKKKTDSKSFLASLGSAIVIDVTNPKVALFFAALLPQFYRDNGTSKVAQFLILGIIIIVIGFIIESSIVLFADRAADLLRTKKSISKYLDKLFGATLIGLGIKLICEKNT